MRDESDGPRTNTNLVLPEAIEATAVAITGAIMEGPRRTSRGPGHIAQHLINKRLLAGLRIEIDEMRDAGRIDPEYEDSAKFEQTLRELLGYLDSDIPDDEVFKVLKQIFLVRATGTPADDRDILPLEFMRIVKRMEAGDVVQMIDLHAYVSMRKKAEGVPLKHDGVRVRDWVKKIANVSSLKYGELIRARTEHLADLDVLFHLSDDGREIVWLEDHDRFTDLGWELCMYVARYDSD